MDEYTAAMKQVLDDYYLKTNLRAREPSVYVKQEHV